MSSENNYSGGKHSATPVRKTRKSDNTGSPKKAGSKKLGLVPVVCIIAAALIILVIAGISVYNLCFYNKVYKGVSLGGVDYGGMTKEEVLNDLSARYSKFAPGDNKMTVRIGDKDFSLNFDKGAASYDLPATAEEIYSCGRTGSFAQRLKDISAFKKSGKECSLAVKIDSSALKKQVKEIKDGIQSKMVPSSFRVDGDNLVVDKGKVGINFNTNDFTDFITERLSKGDFSDAVFEVSETKPDAPDADLIFRSISVEMSEPYVDYEADPTAQTVREGKAGISFDVNALKKALADPAKQTVSVPLTYTYPTRTAAELKSMLFRDVLGQTTTSFNQNLVGRTQNVKLSADFCDNTVLAPGQEFSYNESVGPRTEERGFQYATVYMNGGTDEGLGGGICQTSSTIYSACLRADLEITERHNHSLLVTYVPLGEDATVAWGALDFKFKNNTDYPIKIDMSYSGNTVTCKIIGTQTTAGKRVVIEDNTLSSTPFEIKYKLDKKLAPGTQSVESNGFSAATVETYRLVYVGSELISRTFESKSIYKKADKVILYNPWHEGGGPDDTGETTAPSTEPTTPTSGQEPTTPTSSQEPTTPTSSQEPTTPTSSQEPTTPTSSQEPTTPTSSQEPTTPTSSQEPTTPTSSQEPTATTTGGDENPSRTFPWEVPTEGD